MAGFVANDPQTDESSIKNNAFYPEIDPDECRDHMRIDQGVTARRLRAALVIAIGTVNNELRGWQLEQEALGYLVLADVPGEKIDGVSQNIHLYKQAVYCEAKASLTERYRDYDSTKSGHDKADEHEQAIDDYRRDAIIALRTIMGRSRCQVELL